MGEWEQSKMLKIIHLDNGIYLVWYAIKYVFNTYMC